ncbi:MAG: hypothetical protein AB7E42_07145 [Anaerotignaceae bacterium]
MNYLVFNTTSKPLNVTLTDGSSNVTIVNDAIESIDIVHAEIHEGMHYTANHFYPAVANNAYVYMHIRTGSTKYSHLTMVVQAEAKSYVTFYADSTYTTNGTSVTAFNNNLPSINTTASSIYYAPTEVVVGTLIYEDFVPAGSGSKSISATNVSRNEWILDLDTDYLLRVQNVGGSSVTSDTTITFVYYEVSV